LVGFLKIRKIEDKDLKSKKIKRTVIAIVVLLVIGILIWLWYRFYNKYYW
jgi:predicted permease